ncbi:MAG TPA: subclass B3 metallo-beta-lactamase [Caulobacteraceae bacterium]|nr:subclass B3 metallo-beta-lactamase [Caulobacteraceae bacterium]
MTGITKIALIGAAAACLGFGVANAQAPAQAPAAAPADGAAKPDPNRTPWPPFQITDHMWYVGGANLGAYILKTNKGLILVNTGFPYNTPMLEKTIADAGFDLKDIKILLISHAHIDHDGGMPDIIKATGAKYYVMEGDADVVESGGKLDYHYYAKPSEYYEPTHVDKVLHDGDTVTLGDLTLTAHLTPGHTKGDTTWTFMDTMNGKPRHVVIVGGPLLNGGGPNPLINNPRYPNIVADYRKAFAVMRSLPVDVYVGAHGYYFDLPTKYAKLQAGDKEAFEDPEGYKAFTDKAEANFNKALAKQEAEAAGGAAPAAPAPAAAP